MSGRPTFIKNLTPGMSSRIKARICVGPTTLRLFAYDKTGSIWLTGKVRNLEKKLELYKVYSIIGHKSKRKTIQFILRNYSFIVEEIEDDSDS